MASKYVVAINKKHIFNPVAFAVALTALTHQPDGKLVGGQRPDAALRHRRRAAGRAQDPPLRPGARASSSRRRDDRWSSRFFDTGDIRRGAPECRAYSPLFFFAFVILTEPLTTPPTRRLQIIYGVLVGFLFAPRVPHRRVLPHAGNRHPDRQRLLVSRQPEDQADPDAQGEAAACAGRVRIRLRARPQARLRARSVHGMDARTRRPRHARQPPLLHACLRADRARPAPGRQVLPGFQHATSSRCWRWTPTRDRGGAACGRFHAAGRPRARNWSSSRAASASRPSAVCSST